MDIIYVLSFVCLKARTIYLPKKSVKLFNNNIVTVLYLSKLNKDYVIPALGNKVLLIKLI